MGFRPVVGYEPMLDSQDFTDILLDTCEIYTLFLLGKYGPQTAYGLSRLKVDYFPQPKATTFYNTFDLQKITDMIPEYDRSAYTYSLKRLEKKSLVSLMGFKRKKLYFLSLQGIIWYLQNIDNGFTYLMQNYLKLYPLKTTKSQVIASFYEETFPIIRFWSSLPILNRRLLEVLYQTADAFGALEELNLYIKALNLEVTVFLKHGSSAIANSLVMQNSQGINTNLVDFLRDNELLLNSYLAFLLVNDLKQVSGLEKAEFNYLIPSLTSEIVSAYFENTKPGASSLLSEKIHDTNFLSFFDLSHLFVGMFISNLLWTKFQPMS